MINFLEKIKQQFTAKTETTFPSKQGRDATSCIALMDLHGSLFCLDNQKIMFDAGGEYKVLDPIATFPCSDRPDLDAYEMDNGFAIKYKEHDYFYKAKIDVIKTSVHTYIRLKDIMQPIKAVKIENNTYTIEGE